MAAQKKRLYLDVCTYCRPYDDQSLLPIRLETDAYYLILGCVERGRYAVVTSAVHFAEVEAIEDMREREEVLRLLHRFRTPTAYSADKLRRRAEELCERRIGVADAAHVAFAEATADVLITCDRVLIRRCRANGVRLTVCTPLEFVAMEGLT